MRNPIPLHLHTDYNVLDGLLSSKEVISFCKENDIPGYAMTSHGQFQHFAYYFMEAQKEDIKFCIGLEGYVGEKRNHITILPKNWNGLKNLFTLNNKKVIEQQYANVKKKRINFNEEEILSLKECVILSGCLNGLFNPKNYEENGNEIVKQKINKFKEVFQDDFYFEIMPYRSPEQEEYNLYLVEKSREYNVPLVLTTDSHYAKKEDAKAQKYLMACAFRKKYEDVNYFDHDDFFLYTSEDVKKHLTYLEEDDIVESIENTYRIFDKIDQSEAPISNSMVRQPDYNGIPKFYWEN